MSRPRATPAVRDFAYLTLGLLAMILFVACGNGGDDEARPATDGPTETATEPTATAERPAVTPVEEATPTSDTSLGSPSETGPVVARDIVAVVNGEGESRAYRLASGMTPGSERTRVEPKLSWGSSRVVHSPEGFRMPIPDGWALSEDVIRFIRRWIEQGAQGDDGRAMYDDVTRKAFVACQGENTVAVVDKDTGLLVRLLDVD